MKKRTTRRSKQAVAQVETPEVQVKKTPTNNERCFNQFAKYCGENNYEPVEDAIPEFIKACSEGWPNNKPKKKSSLDIKYRGIANHLGLEIKRGFVAECIQ
jgi:hypothetical protein